MLNKAYWHTVVRATLGYCAVLAFLWLLIGFTAWSGLVFGWDRQLALLFVGGVMNLVWIAALAVLVMAEKIAPKGPWIGAGAGAVLIVWGIVTFFV